MKKVLLIVIALASMMLAGCWGTGEGEKIGVITRLNEQGIFCKTWEGEIVRGGFNGGSGVMGTAYHFTIEDSPDLVAKVKQAMESQQEVKIKYRMELVTFCRNEIENSDNAFLVTIEDIEPVVHDDEEVDAENIPSPVAEPSGDASRDEKLKQLGQLVLDLQSSQ